jgi:hypothetical protein
MWNLRMASYSDSIPTLSGKSAKTPAHRIFTPRNNRTARAGSVLVESGPASGDNAELLSRSA